MQNPCPSVIPTPNDSTGPMPRHGRHPMPIDNCESHRKLDALLMNDTNRDTGSDSPQTELLLH